MHVAYIPPDQRCVELSSSEEEPDTWIVVLDAFDDWSFAVEEFIDMPALTFAVLVRVSSSTSRSVYLQYFNICLRQR